MQSTPIRRPATPGTATRGFYPRGTRTTVGALAVALCLQSGAAGPAEAGSGLIFLAEMNQYQGSGVGGYRDPVTGNEYALIAHSSGTSIVNVTDPFNPYETGFVSGPVSSWRDVQEYQGRAYVTSEGTSAGMQIISLADPEAPFLIRKKDSFTSHTLWIDDVAGVAYCNGASPLGRGFRAYDLAADPDDPPLLINFAPTYIHDLWAGNGVAYTADIFNGGQIRVLDVSSLQDSATVTLTDSWTYPNGATHNVWPHPNGTHLVSTDEFCVGGGTARVWDISDLQNVQLVASISAPNGATPHNAYMKGNLCFFAWYGIGVRVFDLSTPANPINLARYDSPGFGGCSGSWSVYPFLPSGVILDSDTFDGLVLLYFSQEIGNVSGTVTEFGSSNPIENAAVTVTEFFNKEVKTDASGDFGFQLPAGTYTVTVAATGYVSDVAQVVITDGLTTIHDVAFSLATGIDSSLEPTAVSMSAPRPNPTRSVSELEFSIPRAMNVRANVFDISGRHVRTLSSGVKAAGRHSLAWDARDDQGDPVSGGTYLYRLDVAGETRSKKVTLLR